MTDNHEHMGMAKKQMSDDNHKHRKTCPLCNHEKPIQSFTHSGKDYNRFCGVCRLTGTISTGRERAIKPTSRNKRGKFDYGKMLHAPSKQSPC